MDWLLRYDQNSVEIGVKLQTINIERISSLFQGDPVRDLVYRYMGEQEALKRQILTANKVTQDANGLKDLMVISENLLFKFLHLWIFLFFFEKQNVIEIIKNSNLFTKLSVVPGYGGPFLSKIFI